MKHLTHTPKFLQATKVFTFLFILRDGKKTDLILRMILKVESVRIEMLKRKFYFYFLIFGHVSCLLTKKSWWNKRDFFSWIVSAMCIHMEQ